MVLVDYSAYSNGLLKYIYDYCDNKQDYPKEFVRFVLKRIMSIQRKFNDEVILCTDSRNNWRKDFFPEYKAARKTMRKESTFDWNMAFKLLNKTNKIIQENTPFKFIEVEKCEGDDILAVLSSDIYTHLDEDIIIVSEDKDLYQLTTNPRVRIYSWQKSKFLKFDQSPLQFKKEHILRGDVSDGVPNIFSDNDVFVNPNKRQKQLRQKKVDEYINEWTSLSSVIDDKNILTNLERNKKLIDFNMIPSALKEKIHEKTMVVMKEEQLPKSQFRKTLIQLGLGDQISNLQNVKFDYKRFTEQPKDNIMSFFG